MNDKPRLVQVTDTNEIHQLGLAATRGDLNVPHIIAGGRFGNYEVWVDADELRAWRSAPFPNEHV